VIVVIVREQDHIERRQLGNGCRHWMKPLSTCEESWRRIIAEHGIEQGSNAMGFEEQRAVPEPGNAKTG
jgi:hypothetical protein